MSEKTVFYRAWESGTVGDYWICEKCGYVVRMGEYHACPPAQPVSYPAYQPDYYTLLERIEQSLLRIEKLLEKEL